MYADNNRAKAEDLHSRAYVQMGVFVQHLRDTVASHRNIQSDDEQYDDPELWWAEPALEEAETLLSKLDDILITLERG